MPLPTTPCVALQLNIACLDAALHAWDPLGPAPRACSLTACHVSLPRKQPPHQQHRLSLVLQPVVAALLTQQRWLGRCCSTAMAQPGKRVVVQTRADTWFRHMVCCVATSKAPKQPSATTQTDFFSDTVWQVPAHGPQLRMPVTPLQLARPFTVCLSTSPIEGRPRSQPCVQATHRHWTLSVCTASMIHTEDPLYHSLHDWSRHFVTGALHHCCCPAHGHPGVCCQTLTWRETPWDSSSRQRLSGRWVMQATHPTSPTLQSPR